MGLKSWLWLVCVLDASGAALAARSATADIVIDFRDTAQVARCSAEHDVSAIRASADGMEISISGADPFIAGPTIELSAGATQQRQYLLELKLKSGQGGMIE